jgi:hypothetical protein
LAFSFWLALLICGTKPNPVSYQLIATCMVRLCLQAAVGNYQEAEEILLSITCEKLKQGGRVPGHFLHSQERDQKIKKV